MIRWLILEMRAKRALRQWRKSNDRAMKAWNEYIRLLRSKGL